MSDAYVAPAARVLTVLHRPAPDGTQTVCALPFDEDELWVPVERREGDVVCWVCEAEERAEDVQEALL
jgi:hypothetical protein